MTQTKLLGFFGFGPGAGRLQRSQPHDGPVETARPRAEA